MRESLEKMLAKGVDNSLLRFGLGKGYLDLKDNAKAAEHLHKCVEFDPKYSAAWKLLGKAQLGLGDNAAARQAWEKGIKSLYYLRSKSIQRAGFAGGVEADNTAEAPKYELSTTDYDECLACQ